MSVMVELIINNKQIITMNSKVKELPIINELAEVLYNFLPGTPHPYAAKQKLSFPACAESLGLSEYWQGGSKKPAIVNLLKQILDKRRNQFCPLIYLIVEKSYQYRNNKKDPLRKNEIEKLNQILLKLNYKIPELWDSNFFDSLASNTNSQPIRNNQSSVSVMSVDKNKIAELKKMLIDMNTIEDAKKRGFAFERLLKEIFDIHGLDPRASFRNTGEQIDGSFVFHGDTYLLEAKWHKNLIGNEDLLSFSGKLSGKLIGTKGVFVSYSGFSQDGLIAFSKGRASNVICIDGADLFCALDGEISLQKLIESKIRWASESGDAYKPMMQLKDIYRL